MADLASIIAGTDPTAPEQLQATQQQQMAQIAMDPSRWQNLGWGGALAHMLAGATAPSGAVNTVQNITNQNVAAQPDLAAALASPDPYQWAANNPSANPLALSRILASNPMQVAQTRNLDADAAYRNAMAGVQAVQMRLRLGALGGSSGYGGPGAGAPAPSASMPAPSASMPAPAAPLTGGAAPFGSGTYAGAANTAPPLDMSQLPAAGPQRMAWLARLPPAQRAQILSRLPATPGSALGAGGAGPG